MKNVELLKSLEGGDRRSIGRSNEVVNRTLSDPSLFPVLLAGMLSEDSLVRMRAAVAVEKITMSRPEYLGPYKHILINQVAAIPQQEVRWHLAQMFPRLKLTRPERQAVVNILLDFLKDQSKIVQTFSMQALADISRHDPSFHALARRVIERHIRSGSLSTRSRGKKLLAHFHRQSAS
jgi:hypothetical protein